MLSAYIPNDMQPELPLKTNTKPMSQDMNNFHTFEMQEEASEDEETERKNKSSSRRE